MKRTPVLPALALSLLLPPEPAAAQADEPAPRQAGARTELAAGVWTSADGSKVTYEASYFEAYQAVTATDLLRWVPGGAELIPDNRGRRDDEDKRGFGSGGDQVLINGKRLSGKANDIGSALQRIQAGTVARVEVIRGTTAGLDVRSEGTLINIVLDEDLDGGTGSWQLHSGFYGRSDPEFDGLLSWSDSAGALNYLLSAQYGPYNRGNQLDRFDVYRLPGSNAVLERRDISVPMLDSALILNGSLGWSFANGDLLNLNARIADSERSEDETTRVSVPGDADIVTLENVAGEDGLEWEIGGDLEQRLGRGLLKTRLIYSYEDEDENERVSLTSTDPGNVPAQSRVSTASTATEAILRSSYSFAPGRGHNLEIGAEGARNVLEKDVALFEILPDGSEVPVSVFNADSEVNEDRYELFATHFWQLHDAVALESSLNVEYSKIAQVGADVDNARSFNYVKPRFDLRWDIDEASQLRGTVERTVSQLDFGDFVASFDNDDDQVDAGNPELEPEKTWAYRLGWERRLANDTGLVATELFYDDIEDHIDNIRVTDSLSAAGNIGDAERYGITLRGSLRLGLLGLDGAVLDASYTLQDSETTDPFTGATREMSDTTEQEYRINFRHDVADWRFNYNVEIEWNGERTANDINFRERSTSVGPRIHVGMQYALTERIQLWFDTRIATDGHTRRVRDRYVGDVADTALLRVETRDQYFRREHILGLRGRF